MPNASTVQALLRRDLVEIGPDGEPTLTDAGHACLDADDSATVKHPIALVNLVDGTVAGHKQGCKDLTKTGDHASQVGDLEVESRREAYLAYNDDLITESGETEGHWEINWAPCADHVPALADETPAVDAPSKPAAAAKGSKATSTRGGAPKNAETPAAGPTIRVSRQILAFLAGHKTPKSLTGLLDAATVAQDGWRRRIEPV